MHPTSKLSCFSCATEFFKCQRRFSCATEFFKCQRRFSCATEFFKCQRPVHSYQPSNFDKCRKLRKVSKQILEISNFVFPQTIDWGKF